MYARHNDKSGYRREFALTAHTNATPLKHKSHAPAPACCDAFAALLKRKRSLQSGADFRVVQGLLGPVDGSTRVIYWQAMWVMGGPSWQGYLVALLPKPVPFDGRR